MVRARVVPQLVGEHGPGRVGDVRDAAAAGEAPTVPGPQEHPSAGFTALGSTTSGCRPGPGE